MSDKAALTIGLTGGIASGKTEVADRFASLGIAIIDTDRIAHDLVTPGSDALSQLRAVFGPDALDGQGRLRRGWLRRRIFDDPEAKQTLEDILHPMIREQVVDLRSRVTAPYCIIVAPLLFETSFQENVDRVLVVDANPETQIMRLMARDGVSESDARTALSVQLSREERRARADDIIENDGDLVELDRQVSALHQHYSSLAE
jgi:dephospho-CoA kinase